MSAGGRRLLVFGYDFPHRRSVDFLLRMCIAGYVPELYIGASWRDLPHRRSSVVVSYPSLDLFRAAELCRAFGIRYESLDHNSPEALELIRAARCEVGVIASARILNPQSGRYP